MDITLDSIMARFTFSSQDYENRDVSTRIVRLRDAKSNFQEMSDTDANTIYTHGFKVISLRRSSAMTFDNAGKLLQHSVQYLIVDNGPETRQHLRSFSAKPGRVKTKILSIQDLYRSMTGASLVRRAQRTMPSIPRRTTSMFATLSRVHIRLNRMKGNGLYNNTTEMPKHTREDSFPKSEKCFSFNNYRTIIASAQLSRQLLYNMDLTTDVLFGRLVFDTGLGPDSQSPSSRIVRLDDAKSEAQEVFVAHSDSWEAMGTKVLRVRRSPSTIFDNAEKLVQHATVVGRALKSELDLHQTPKLVEATILYGDIDPSNQDMDIIHAGPIAITIQNDMPSSSVKTGPTSGMVEEFLRRFYGESAFACLRARHSRWDLVEVSHPLSEPMESYPWITKDTRTLMERWLCFYSLQPSELLVRRVASSDEGAHICRPLVSSNITGDLLVAPEHRMTLKFVVWTR
ncbi:unnamed protein product [Fusarium equiseti]|uniref:Uncharacterized protein n=1 Tax=Fusarium equiseti TaxID=61235 RepID=A0A8J2IS56_FUSEQ|nr:unnamed protein product [Fusarium equiseti]